MGSRYMKTISRYSVSKGTARQVASLPVGTSYHAAAWSNGSVYTFGGYTSTNTRVASIIKYDPETNNATKLNVSLPFPVTQSCAVARGSDEILIIGGSTGTNGNLTVSRFTPSTETVTKVDVTGYAAPLSATACAYVPKLDRVYLFGGQDTSLLDQVLYIDMSRPVAG